MSSRKSTKPVAKPAKQPVSKTPAKSASKAKPSRPGSSAKPAAKVASKLKPAAPASGDRVAPWDLPSKLASSTKDKAAARQSSSAQAKISSKQAIVLELLRGTGATIDQMKQVTGWQAHSVRGMLSGVLRKRMGLNVECTRSKDGSRLYRISDGSGVGSTSKLASPQPAT